MTLSSLAQNLVEEPAFLCTGRGVSLSPAESMQMLAFRVPKTGQMFVSTVSFTRPRFAPEVAIL